ncbi:MAG: hypothetical protein KDE22_09285 [Rhodobacterales bacterium]|nr:hypothetical protein [Rhodobacterales bacterium]
MAHVRATKTNFTAGEVSPWLAGRADLRAFENGAGRLRNVFIHPGGGLSRRDGLRHVDTARGDGRLVAFEFNTEQVYLLAFTDGFVDILADDALVDTVATPWTTAQIGQVVWTQSADTLLVVHPDVPPKRLTRNAGGTWLLEDWSFHEKDGRVYQPHHKFADDDVTLQPSATTGTVTLTASADHFTADHVGGRMRLQDKEVEITAVTNATTATALVKETLVDTTASADWEEQALSAVRGWPTSVCFHQDRLVIGGSRDLPNRLWLSKSADLFNFDLGEGLDDESIEFAILSDQVNAIRAVFSGRHLQVFTSGAEWMVSGAPLTPVNLQLNRQTRIGSPVDRSVPPRDVDGATLFVSRGGTELREFLFADVEQAYQASDLAMLAQHLVVDPRDQDYDNRRRLFHLVMADGSLATLTVFRAEKVTAWTRQETDGVFRSVCVAGGDTYVLTERNGAHAIERFDPDLDVDAGMTGTTDTPADTWTGLDHLEGRTVKVVADGAVQADAAVSGGAVTLDKTAGAVQAGLAFTHEVEPLPPAVPGDGGAAMGLRLRPISVTLRLRETTALFLDVGRGLSQVPFKRFGADLLDAPPPTFTGDRKVRAFGWREGGTDPLWRIRQDTPLPFHLLSVVSEVGVNG